MAPTDVLWRLVESATGRAHKHEAAISKHTAAFISILFTVLYVVPFYLFRKTRPSASLNRDAPSVIQARIRAVTTTVTISTITTLYLLQTKGQLSTSASLHHLGLWPISPLAILQPVLLTFVLFLGPLFEDIFLRHSLWPLPEAWGRIVTSLSSSIGYRNYIAGPVTEELLFRSTILPLHLLSPLADSPKQLVFLTPLYFGVAHIHHFYEFRLTHPETPLVPAILRTVFQFAYTTIFGWYAAFIYLRTGSFFAVCVIHAFCNYMGFPRFWGKVSYTTFSGPRKHKGRLQATRRKDDPVLGSVENSGDGTSHSSSEMRDTVMYYVLLIAGAVSFSQLLFTMTEFKSLQLVNFGRQK